MRKKVLILVLFTEALRSLSSLAVGPRFSNSFGKRIFESASLTSFLTAESTNDVAFRRWRRVSALVEAPRSTRCAPDVAFEYTRAAAFHKRKYFSKSGFEEEVADRVWWSITARCEGVTQPLLTMSSTTWNQVSQVVSSSRLKRSIKLLQGSQAGGKELSLVKADTHRSRTLLYELAESFEFLSEHSSSVSILEPIFRMTDLSHLIPKTGNIAASSLCEGAAKSFSCLFRLVKTSEAAAAVANSL